jgi:hypothetical protein
MFKDNLDKWSNDLHCIVHLLKKIPQTEPNEKRAQECIEILFEQKKQNTMDHSNVLNMAQE